MTYARIYADAAGESHFEDVVAPLAPVDYAPPAPPVNLSAPEPARAFVFMSAPPVFYLAGEVEVEASDGEARRFGPGGVTLGEDTTGKGHRSRVVGEVEALLAVVQLAD
jgi:hypothetical protein